MTYSFHTRQTQSTWSPEKRDGYKKYWQQTWACKNRLDRRGAPITMEMSFEEWWNFWEASGLWSKRGCRSGMWAMVRKDNLGAYSLDNVTVKLVARSSFIGIKCRRQKTPTKLVRCPYCQTEGAIGPMTRWHFERCWRRP